MAGLRFTNGSNQYVRCAASASINNLDTSTVLMWVNLTTVSVAAQRNFWGKSSGANRNVAFISPTVVGMNYGRSTTIAAVSASLANVVGLAANEPFFLAISTDVGTSGNNRILSGTRGIPATEPSAYASQTNGAGTHDDSASAWDWENASGGTTTNTLPGTVYSVQVFNRVLSDAEIRDLQYRWDPGYAGCVQAHRYGQAGAIVVLDESGYGNHGAPSGSPVPSADIAPVLVRQPESAVRTWKRALFAPSGTGTLTATLDAATLSATGALPITGAATATLAAATVAATGTLAISGALTATLGTATLAATGALALSGSLTATLANATVAGVGTLPIVGTATATLAAATLSGTGTIGSFATLTVTLAAATLTATGTLPIVGAATVTLSAATLAGTGALPIVATLTATLATVTLSATGTGSDTGTSAAYMAASLFHVADTDEIYYTADTDQIYFTATEG